MAKKTKRGLSAEDRTLWNRVAKTATPLNHASRRTPGEPFTTKPARPADPGAERAPVPTFRLGENAVQSSALIQPAPSLSRHLAMAPVRMDHGAYKKMTRGKLKPEGRLDLHGMTLAQAHPALIRFIADAHDAGKRLVLVITGKGRDRDSGDPIPIRRGVLKHQVPSWLHAPPLGAIVLDIREAHQRHGGGGAYYVYLKRRG
jgi:DNA-nicking Smr family endonuclease